MLTIDDFQKLDIRIGTVLSAEKVPETDKLLKFELDFGTEKRTIIGGWAVAYPEPAKLVGTQLAAILNLEPRTIRGIASQGMLLSAVHNEQPVALHPDRSVENGSVVR
ncbi:MAG TPA: hypothetical protein VLE93_03065 [Candidatus Saccharimonadales bacterium]|nr:hypothetical protein [Candidatus Saccharimonadales bacterium]